MIKWIAYRGEQAGLRAVRARVCRVSVCCRPVNSSRVQRHGRQIQIRVVAVVDRVERPLNGGNPVGRLLLSSEVLPSEVQRSPARISYLRQQILRGPIAERHLQPVGQVGLVALAIFDVFADTLRAIQDKLLDGRVRTYFSIVDPLVHPVDGKSGGTSTAPSAEGSTPEGHTVGSRSALPT